MSPNYYRKAGVGSCKSVMINGSFGVSSMSIREGRKVARMICRILLTVAGLAVAGFLLLVLIGVWAGYQQETAALGFSGPSERYLASQAGFPNDPKAYRESLRKMRRNSAAEDNRVQQASAGQGMLAMEE
jgi:hypothetical protein